MNTIVPYAINPSSFSSSNTVVLSSITLALEAMDKEEVYKIAGSGLDFGKSSPLTISKIVMQLKASSKLAQ
jgi:hypothetical protein